MRKYLVLFAALAAAAVLLVPLGASAKNHNGSAATTKVYKSWKCAAPVKPYDFTSWACTTITVPLQMNAGQKATVIYTFKAKTKMNYVDVCFGKVNSGKCAYRHKYVVINRGSTVKRVLQQIVPMVTTSGTYNVDNYTRFYKPPKYGGRDTYWVAHSFVCIIASGDETDYQCPAGK